MAELDPSGKLTGYANSVIRVAKKLDHGVVPVFWFSGNVTRGC